jgi:hypothetical protein
VIIFVPTFFETFLSFLFPSSQKLSLSLSLFLYSFFLLPIQFMFFQVLGSAISTRPQTIAFCFARPAAIARRTKGVHAFVRKVNDCIHTIALPCFTGKTKKDLGSSKNYKSNRSLRSLSRRTKIYRLLRLLIPFLCFPCHYPNRQGKVYTQLRATSILYLTRTRSYKIGSASLSSSSSS